MSKVGINEVKAGDDVGVGALVGVAVHGADGADASCTVHPTHACTRAGLNELSGTPEKSSRVQCGVGKDHE